MYTYSAYPRSVVSVPIRWIAFLLAFALVVSSLSFAGTFPHRDSFVVPDVPALPAHLGEISSDSPTPLIPDMSNMPLSFVPNAGQSDPSIRFQAEAMGGKLFFTQNDIVFSLPTKPTLASANSTSQHTQIRLQFVGGAKTPTIEGIEKQYGTTNYLYGSDSSKWITNVPNYAGIVYQHIYPGIDLRYDGTTGNLKGTYTVAAGANPNLIRWSYGGATNVSVDRATGNMIIGLAGATAPMIEKAPVAWQEIGGATIPVAVRYTLTSDAIVGFALGSYNAAYPLIIDPAITYATYVGGTSPDSAEAIAVDEKSGFVYVTGWTDSSDLDMVNALPGNFGIHKSGESDRDIFVSKIDVSTNKLVYSTYIGGDQLDRANDIALGKDGHAYITGFTQSPLKLEEVLDTTKKNSPEVYFKTSFPISPTELSNEQGTIKANTQNTAYGYLLDRDANGLPSESGEGDAFVAKISPDGSNLEYSTYLGGSGKDEGFGIAVHASKGDFYENEELEYAYVTGETNSSDFPVLQGLPNGTDKKGPDVFVTRIGPNGKSLQYSTYLGGEGNDIGRSIVVTGTSLFNSEPILYIAGETNSTDIFTGTFTKLKSQPIIGNKLNGNNSTNTRDGFVTRIVSATGGLTYTMSTYLGGSGDDTAMGLMIDSNGNMYVAGQTDSTQFAGVVSGSSYQSTNKGNIDAFITQIGVDGTIDFSSFLGSTQEDRANAVDIDSKGNIYVTGSTAGADFPTAKLTPQQPDKNDGSDAFVTKFNPGGTELVYSIFVGGGGPDESKDIVVLGSDEQAFAFIAGETSSNTEFPITKGSLDDHYDNGDGFVAKIGPPRLYFEGYDPPDEDSGIVVNPTLQNRKPKHVSEASGIVEIVPRLSDRSSTPFDVSISTRECGDAVAGDDFEAVQKSYAIAAGEDKLPENLSVEIFDDTEDEPHEYFCLDVSSGFGETQPLTITIGDNDGPKISLDAMTVDIDEPMGPSTSAVSMPLKVELSAASPQTIALSIAAVPIEGVLGESTTPDDNDYQVEIPTNENPTVLDILFKPGETSKEVVVEALPDTIKERPESFQVWLETPKLDDTEAYLNFNKNSDTELITAFLEETAMTSTVTIRDSYSDETKSLIGFVDSNNSVPVTYTLTAPDNLKSVLPVTTSLYLRLEDVDGQTILLGDTVRVQLSSESDQLKFNNPYELEAGETSFERNFVVYFDPKVYGQQNIPVSLTVMDKDRDLASEGTVSTAMVVLEPVKTTVYLPLIPNLEYLPSLGQ